MPHVLGHTRCLSTLIFCVVVVRDSKHTCETRGDNLSWPSTWCRTSLRGDRWFDNWRSISVYWAIQPLNTVQNPAALRTCIMPILSKALDSYKSIGVLPVPVSLVTFSMMYHIGGGCRQWLFSGWYTSVWPLPDPRRRSSSLLLICWPKLWTLYSTKLWA